MARDLDRLLSDLNLSPAQAADLIGVKRATVQRWLRGQGQPAESAWRLLEMRKVLLLIHRQFERAQRAFNRERHFADEYMRKAGLYEHWSEVLAHKVACGEFSDIVPGPLDLRDWKGASRDEILADIMKILDFVKPPS